MHCGFRFVHRLSLFFFIVFATQTVIVLATHVSFYGCFTDRQFWFGGCCRFEPRAWVLRAGPGLTGT